MCNFDYSQIYRLLLQANTESVRKLLSLHPYSHSESFISVDELLRKMPLWSVSFSVCFFIYHNESLKNDNILLYTVYMCTPMADSEKSL